MACSDGTEYFEIDMEEGGAVAHPSNSDLAAEDENELLWAAIERLPSVRRNEVAIVRREALGSRRYSLITRDAPPNLIDVKKLDARGRQAVLDKAFATSEQDNYILLSGIKQRYDTVGLQVPKVEVKFLNLNLSAKVYVGNRALPSLLNYCRDKIEGVLSAIHIVKPHKETLTILNKISGVVRPGRMTLLLGPPGSGKTTLLLALAGKLDTSLKKTGEVTYNGATLDKFYAQRTSAYVSQTDNHIGELTVRETLDFAARCQGASKDWADSIKDLVKLEKEKDIRPSPEIDAFMKAASIGGSRQTLVTDYNLKVLGLDVCADIMVGSDMVRGVSGGQRRRVTSGEMINGPRKTLFMDEISTGLDSSTTFQIVKCMLNFVHQMEATVLMSLLQPAPETFDLFDDLILLSDGYIVYQGPRKDALEFFESIGFSVPPRKGIADFLQEVTSKKDQEQYWSDQTKPYVYIPCSKMAELFRQSKFGKAAEANYSTHTDEKAFPASSLARTQYAISNKELLRACMSRELILLSRHRFLYIFRTCQVACVGAITCTMFLRTRIHPTDEINGNLYMSCLFFGLVHMMFNGFSELSITISRLPVFYKQRDSLFYPAWAFALPSYILRIPYSVIEAVVWTCVIYYTVGFAPYTWRFFGFMFVLFSIHQMALGLFRLMAGFTRDITVANTLASASLLVIFLLGGFIVPRQYVKPWFVWAFWISPLTYGQRAVAVNEFTSLRWQMPSRLDPTRSVGDSILHSLGIPSSLWWYWIGVGVLLAYSIVFNILFTLCLTHLMPLGKAQSLVPDNSTQEKEKPSKEITGGNGGQFSGGNSSQKIGMILPFTPYSMTFHNVNYYVDMPKEMKAQGVPENRLQLLSNVTGVFRPNILTTLMGSSGAGKTTLMDVLAGRKTGGYIEGDIKISGYVKEQSTFARIAGYVEQTDIHSPQVTIEESLWFSSNLRLPKDVSKKDRLAFVEQVILLVELDGMRNSLVGLPGSTGLSTEQRKRLTIAVELVANPSIIFMDEPTSGLDARAAAIVMRTVRNTVDTGRTVVCTIHQPSIDIFESFDELILMKRGGCVIYGGPLGVHSQDMIKYFQAIPGVPPISEGYNPATWMLEVSTPACEEKFGIDFAAVYKASNLFKEREVLIQQLSVPAPGTLPLKFSSEFAQDDKTQFKVCFWKQNLVYWRSPRYNVVRLIFTTLSALIFGAVYWNVGTKRETTQDLFLVMGALYSACLFVGVNNASSVQPVVSVERTVYYREKAAKMYSSYPYAMAQGLVEIPYIALQTIVFGTITYFMIQYEKSAGKFILYLLYMFLTFMYFTFYGMMAVGLTPSQHLAAVVSSAFYSLWNLLSGFLIPKPNIPPWWIWFYYICPVSWTLRGVITSQLGDVETRLVGPGFDGTVKEFLQVALGFDSGWNFITVVILIAFSLLFFGVYATSIKVLNFQRR